MIERGLEQAGISHRTKRFTRIRELQAWLQTEDSAASLVFLDLNLPGEKGQVAIELLRKHRHYKNTPLLILTTSMSAKDVESCYASGANAYHVKPLETPRFHETVAHIASYWFDKAVIPQRVL